MNYRIKFHQFETAAPFYTAEFKHRFGFWVKIGINRDHFTILSRNVVCENICEAYDRIEKHKNIMHHSREWYSKKSCVIKKISYIRDERGFYFHY